MNDQVDDPTDGGTTETAETAESEPQTATVAPEDVCVCLEAVGREQCSTASRVRVELDRVELFYHNEMPSASISETEMFPLNTHAIRLQAVVWARPVRPDCLCDFEPYWNQADRTIRAADHYYSLGSSRPDIRTSSVAGYNRANPPSVDDWRNQRLQDGTEVRRWPANWPTLQFDWRKLAHQGTASDSAKNRTYTYASEQIRAPDRTPESGWSVRRSFGAGAHRFKVTARAPGYQTGQQSVLPRPVTSCTDREQADGKALTLLVRNSAIPSVRDSNATLRETLRWATMFLTVPYEWGGHWFGGKTGPSRGGAAGYEGYGIDCSGFVSAAALLGGTGWAQWRRGSASFPGTNLTGTHRREVQAGDIIYQADDPATPQHEGHIRLVYRRIDTTDPANPRIVCIEASGSARKVAYWPRNAAGEPDPAGYSIGGAQLNDFIVRRLTL